MSTEELKTVAHLAEIFLTIAAVCTTMFPVLYLFSPWYRSNLGRAVMIQSVSVAFAVDITFVFRHWRFTDDLFKIYIINIGILAFIAGASLYLTVMLFLYNFRKELPDAKSEEAVPQ